METPTTSFRLKPDTRELLRQIVEKTRLSAALIVEDGIRLVAKRERINGKKEKR